MANEKEIVNPTEGQPEQKSRRDFVKTSAQVAVTAPAVAVLLSGMSKPANAIPSASAASHSHILDDYTSGNENEDVDAFKEGNFNFYDGKPQQDDHV
jgi:hypothetical protein